jgi:DnaJ-class molecular chaperone
LIVLEVLEHPHFIRRGDDLQLRRCSVHLARVLCEKNFSIPIEHLDGRIISLCLPRGELFSPQFAYAAHREGMPKKGSSGIERGKLVIVVDVIFPDRVGTDQAEALRRSLGGTPLPSLIENQDPEASSGHAKLCRLTDWVEPAQRQKRKETPATSGAKKSRSNRAQRPSPHLQAQQCAHQ